MSTPHDVDNDDIWAGTYGEVWRDEEPRAAAVRRGPTALGLTIVLQLIWTIVVAIGWMYGTYFVFVIAGGEWSLFDGYTAPNRLVFYPLWLLVTIGAGAIVGEPSIRYRRRPRG